MVLCRYFQQGNCRFGQNCRFEHISPQYAGSTVSPMLRQSNQPTSTVTAPRNVPANSNLFRPPPKKDANDIFTLMLQDLTESERGGVWPLSCYNFWPAISHGNVPGLEDLSPDEMRHLQLQAQAAGNIEACNQQIQQMYQQARARFNSLKNRTPETLAIIESMTRSPSPASSQFSFARGNNVVQDSWPTSSPALSQSSIFAAAAASVPNQGQTSTFGGSPGFASNQTSVFSPTNGFAPNQGSIFAPANGQQSVFGGGPSQNSVFGGAPQQTNQAPFATSPPQSSIFGGAVPVQQTSPFVGATVVPQSSPFAAAPSVGQSGGSIFGGASSAVPQTGAFSFALPNAFGASTGTAAAPFGVSTQPGVFAAAAVQNTAQPAGSIFGGGFMPSANPSNAAQGGNIVLNSTIYTAVAQLTESEKREFEAEQFTVGNIPSRPPPRELC